MVVGSGGGGGVSTYYRPYLRVWFSFLLVFLGTLTFDPDPELDNFKGDRELGLDWGVNVVRFRELEQIVKCQNSRDIGSD